MKEAELDLKKWTRAVLEQECEANRFNSNLLTQRNMQLQLKINQLDVETTDIVRSFKEQLNQSEYTALRKAMRRKGTNDQVYLAVATSIHIRCKIGNDTEHVIKLPRRNLIINTSPLYHHFYYFPYKYRIERRLLTDETLESWFEWILTMLMNEFKM